MKIAPLYHALNGRPDIEPVIVHTGQHYDLNMSDVFFRDFKLPAPHIHLDVGSGTHAEQTGKVMIAYEKILMEKSPDLVVVVGDVNSTLAATLAAVKLGIRVAHLEAGLRSFDRNMPEELNRLATDALADYLWTPSDDGDENLLREGVAPEKISRVGNIMIDSLEMVRDQLSSQNLTVDHGVEAGKYGVVTLHRPSNVDDGETLNSLCGILIKISRELPLVFPIHPRTRARMENFGLYEELEAAQNIELTPPLGYMEFMGLVSKAGVLITDSGGIQEESTYLGIPCLTLRENTERPVTVTLGTNVLCNAGNLESHLRTVLDGTFKTGEVPELWDGNTAHRVADLIQEIGKG
ncbi:MAG: UDP-N-acetylglucosamine 2-epimerase (non-hydrolyzing) [Desulfobacterales bacterium]|nr:UDP-N-acetylglucosamine 2-epimerase (non-hydrolyzing) [Desulfobacterales bacterium]